jgi:hypothetical protein
MSGDLRFSVSVDEVTSDEPEVQKEPAGVSWDFVGGRPAQPSIEVAYAAEEPEPGIEVEIDRPRRSREASDGGDDEIEQLRRERAQFEQIATAERQWREQTDQAIAHARDRDAIAVEYHNELQRIEDAKSRYSNASYYGRHSEMAEIAEEIAQRTQHKKTLEGVHEALDQRSVLPQQPQYQAVSDPFDAWVDAANLLPEDKAYLRQRKEFVQANPDHAQLLQSAANLAEKREGLQPGSRAYHDRIDQIIGLADADDVSPSQSKQARRQGGATRRPMAAPGSRSTGRAPESRIHLSEWDIAQAKQMNIPLQTYAREYKAKANQNQYDKSITGGRLHASYSVNQYEDSY